MSSSANTFAIKGPTPTGTIPASHATKRCTSPNSNAVTSYPVGTQLLGTSLTMSHPNALPAIFSRRENSGFLAKLLTVESRDELRNLCNKRTEVESFRTQISSNYIRNTKYLQPLKPVQETWQVTAKQWDNIKALRERRTKLLSSKTGSLSASVWHRKRVAFELYYLTGHHGYWSNTFEGGLHT